MGARVVGFIVFAIVAVVEDATVGFEVPATVGTVPAVGAVPAVVGFIVSDRVAVVDDATVGLKVGEIVAATWP